MGVSDKSLLDLSHLVKFVSWIYWGKSGISSVSGEVNMADVGQTICCECGLRVSESSVGYPCQKCSRVFCEGCVRDTVRLLSLISDRASFVPVLRVNINLGASLVIRYIHVIRPDKSLNYRHRIIPVRDLTGLRLTQYPFAAPRAADLGTQSSIKGNSRALATVSAIIDGTGSVGEALGPLLAGYISTRGWNSVFFMLILSLSVAGLLLVRVVRNEIKEKVNEGKWLWFSGIVH